MTERGWGSPCMAGRLRRVLVRRPGSAFADADPKRWHYTRRPDPDRAAEEHDAFCEILRRAGAEVLFHDVPVDSADALYVHDPCLVADSGAILLNMGKPLRSAEPEAIGETLTRLGIPILGALRGDARAEGGDLLWLDRSTLAVGVGTRTNVAGADRLQELLAGEGVHVIPIQLPPPPTPDACLHLMSFVSLVDRDLAVAYPPLMPPGFREALEAHGFTLVEVPDEEYATQGPNVLALAPRHCLLLEPNKVTAERLRDAGCTVETYRGEEISLVAEGGPTCLTRPILRDRL